MYEAGDLSPHRPGTLGSQMGRYRKGGKDARPWIILPSPRDTRNDRETAQILDGMRQGWGGEGLTTNTGGYRQQPNWDRERGWATMTNDYNRAYS